MLVPPDRTPGDLNPLPDRIIHRLVRHNDIAPLTKRRNHTRDCRERLRIHDTSRRPEESRDVRFGLHMHVLSAVEAGRTARTNAVGPQRLNGFFFEGFVADEVVEVVGREICDGAAVGELHFGARGSSTAGSGQSRRFCWRKKGIWGFAPYDDGPLLVFCFFEGGLWRDERFRRPVFNELVDFLERRLSAT